MTFPVIVVFKRQVAKIYKPAKGFAFYRVVFVVDGKRRMLTFSTYGAAHKEAKKKVRELHKGQKVCVWQIRGCLCRQNDNRRRRPSLPCACRGLAAQNQMDRCARISMAVLARADQRQRFVHRQRRSPVGDRRKKVEPARHKTRKLFRTRIGIVRCSTNIYYRVCIQRRMAPKRKKPEAAGAVGWMVMI